ncbi:tail fiber domain-containing protein [Patescibacteria group bacterium]|nr:tail fiber domain-containing protein [Patescibacteria group bacterium]
MFKRTFLDKKTKASKLFKPCLGTFVISIFLITLISSPFRFTLADEINPENENKVLTTINETANFVYSFINSIFKKQKTTDEIITKDLTPIIPADKGDKTELNLITTQETQETPTSTIPTETATTPTATNLLQPFIVTTSGITEAEFTRRINILENSLKAEIYRMASQLAPTGSITPESNFQAIALSQIIDNLDLVTISRATITGSTFTGSQATITNLASTDLTTTNLTVSGINNFNGITNLSNASSTQLTVSDKLWLGNLLTTGNTISATNDSGLALYDNASNGIFIEDGGNIGIGSTSPAQKLSVDGNTYITGGLGVGVTTTTAGAIETSGNVIVGGDLQVSGDSMVIGDTISDTLVINSSINSNLIPDLNAMRDMGSPAYYWDDIYTDALYVNNLSAASTTISGTQSSLFTINSDNSTLDTEDMDLVFFRGTVVPNALISWNSGLEKFDFNQPVFFQNDSSTTTVPSLEVRAKAGQTADVLKISDSTGASYLNIDSNGKVGIGTTTLTKQLNLSGGFYVGGTGTSTIENNLQVNGQIQIGTGTAYLTANELSTTGDFTISTQSEDSHLTLQSMGRVGVATSTPWGVLSVEHNGSNAGMPVMVISDEGASNASLMVDWLGNTGVGTNNPSSLFHVGSSTPTYLSGYRDAFFSGDVEIDGNTYFNGATNFSSASSTQLTVSDKSWLGNLLTTSNTISATNDSGVAIYDNASNGIFVQDGGNIGIGTTSPFAKLSVKGAGTTTGINFQTTNSSDTPLVTVLDSGNVGIGTTAPGGKLQVYSANDVDAISVRSGSSGSYAGYSIGRTSIEGYLGIVANTNNFLTGAETGNLVLKSGSSKLLLGTGNSIVMTINSSSNVGIGTTAPSQQLEITGDFEMPNTTFADQSGIIYKGSTPFIHNFNYGLNSGGVTTLGKNLFIGEGAGNLTMGSIATIENHSSGNIGMGFNVLRLLTNGFNNTVIGNSAGINTTTGANNVFIGEQSGLNNTSGQSNVFVGGRSGFSNTTGFSNTGVGYDAGYGLTTARDNTYLGNGAGKSNNTGGYNVVIGKNAGGSSYGGKTYDSNTLIGYNSGYVLDGGNNNTFLGYQTGNSVTSGDSNILIGYDIDTPAVDTSNHLNIGNTIYGDLSSGNVGIGTISPFEKLHVEGNISLGDTVGKEVILFDGVGSDNYGIGTEQYNGLWYTNIYGGTNAGISFRTAGPSGTVLAVIKNSGNVGIGTTSPQSLLHLGGTPGALSSGLTFGDGDTGFYEAADDNLYVTIAGARRGYFGVSGFFGNNNDAFGLMDEASSGTNPTIIPQKLDFDTGIGRADADQLSLIAGGVEGHRISEDAGVITHSLSGNVGIGTTSPFAKLSVKGAGTTTGINFQTTDSADSPLVTVLDSGNVGIGTASPGSSLEIAKNGEPEIRLVRTTDPPVNGLISASIGSYVTGGGINRNNGYIRFIERSASTIPITDLAFGLATFNNQLPYEVMRIANTGNVGIGTTSPQSLLHLGGTPGALSSGLTFGDGDTGFYESADDRIYISINGALRAGFTSNAIFAGTNIDGNPAMMSEVSSPSNPVFVFAGDVDTGLGSAAADQLSLIAGAKEIARLTENTTEQFIINPQADLTGTAAAPSLAFGDGDTGFYESADDIMYVGVGGTNKMFWNNVVFSGTSLTSPQISYTGASATVPVFSYAFDGDTGIGRAAADQLSLIAGGVEGHRISEDAGVITHSLSGNVGIGTTNPITPLHVGYNGSGSIATFARTDAAPSSLELSNASGIFNFNYTGGSGGLRWQLGGVSKLTLDASGNIGIGTTSPFAKLSVKGAGTTTGINFQTTNSSDTPLVTVLDSGNVGIGTDSPNNKIQVQDLINFDDTLQNTSLGKNAGNLGQYNSFIGYEAGKNITSSWNTGVGWKALMSATNAERNSAFGYYSLFSNSSGSRNASFGYVALSSNTTGNYNTAFGSNALTYNQTGSSNVAIGQEAGSGSTGASNISNNVFIGNAAGKAIRTGGNNNILIGHQAGDSITTGASNILIGYNIDTPAVDTSNHLNIGNAIYGDLSSGNVGIGTTTPQSLLHLGGTPGILSSGLTFGDGDTGFYESSDDVVVIHQGGTDKWSMTNGKVSATDFKTTSPNTGFWLNNNVGTSIFSGGTGIVNYHATVAHNFKDNYAGNSVMYINSTSGNVGIGTTTPQGLFAVATSTNASFFVVDDQTGNIGMGIDNPSYQLQLSTDSAAKPGTATWTVDSDERLKNVNGDFTRGLSALEGLYPSYFNYKPDNERGIPSNREYVGLIAQDVQKVIPEAVKEGKDGFLSVESDPIFWTMLNAIKELALKVGSDNISYSKDTLQVLNDTGEPQMKLAYDQENLAEFKVSAVGDLSISTAGKDIRLPDDNMQICSGGACPTISTPQSVVSARSGEVRNDKAVQNFEKLTRGTGNLIVENVAYINGALGVGTPAPGRIMDVYESQSDPQMRISYDDDLYSEFNVSATGDLTISASGGDVSVLNENLRVCSDDGCPSVVSQIQDKGNLVVENSLLALGNVGIGGTVSPDYTLDVQGTLRAYGITDASDIRLKTNIRNLTRGRSPYSEVTNGGVRPLSQTSATLQNIQKLRGVKFEWKDSTFGTGDQIGFIAQEVEKVYPELVSTDNDGLKSVQYGKFTAVLLEAVKDLINWGETIEYRSARLEDRTTQLEKENASLKQKTQSLESRIEALENILRQ